MIPIIIKIGEDADMDLVETLIAEAPGAIANLILQVYDQSADEIALLAQATCPRASGELADSIHTEVTSNGVDIVADTPYANIVDENTGFLSGTLFLYEPILQARIIEAIYEYFGMIM